MKGIPGIVFLLISLLAQCSFAIDQERLDAEMEKVKIKIQKNTNKKDRCVEQAARAASSDMGVRILANKCYQEWKVEDDALKIKFTKAALGMEARP